MLFSCFDLGCRCHRFGEPSFRLKLTTIQIVLTENISDGSCDEHEAIDDGQRDEIFVGKSLVAKAQTQEQVHVKSWKKEREIRKGESK